MELRAGISQAAIEQWGYLQKQAEKWIYPIPVLEAFIATKTCISNNHSAAGYVGYWTWDKDITTEYAYSWNNYPSYCFMIGKVQQQWGYGNSESTQTFPIKFTNSVIGIYGSKRAINYEYTFAATSITNTNFFMSTRNSEGSSRVIACNWLAIGQQQTK